MRWLVLLMLLVAACGEPPCEPGAFRCMCDTVQICTADSEWADVWECSGAGGHTVQSQAMCRNICGVSSR